MRQVFKYKCDSGMTLVEILASLVILGIVIVSFISIFGQSALQNKTTDKIMQGSNYAGDLMEHFVAMSHKGSSLDSAGNYLVDEKKFKRISNLYFSKKNSREKFDVEFILQSPVGYENYKVTRVIIKDGNNNTIAESLLYWRVNNE